MKRIFFIIIILFSACNSQNNTQLAYEPDSLNDLFAYINKTDGPICDLNLGKISEEEIGSATLAEFVDHNNAVTHENAAQPITVRSMFRRAALARRLKATENSDLDEIRLFYQDMMPEAIQGNDLGSHKLRMVYWESELKKQIARTDVNSHQYHIRFCILSEGRARDFYTTRLAIEDAVAHNKIDRDTLMDFFALDYANSDVFQAEVLNRYLNSNAVKTPLDRALLRGRNKALLKNDPKTADAFWLARDAEIAAMHQRITTYDYGTLADKLEDMASIDQTLRKLWSASRTEKNTHFESKIELKKFQDGISKRVIVVDAFNTQTFKAMMQGREWMRDDKDGIGSAHNAWLIVQHADRDPEFQEEMLEKLEAGLSNPGVSKSDYAYLFDRVMVKRTDRNGLENRMQRYGSQGRCLDDGSWEPFTLEDPENIDKIRAEVGLGPLSEYKKVFRCNG